MYIVQCTMYIVLFIKTITFKIVLTKSLSDKSYYIASAVPAALAKD